MGGSEAECERGRVVFAWLDCTSRRSAVYTERCTQKERPGAMASHLILYLVYSLYSYTRSPQPYLTHSVCPERIRVSAYVTRYG